MFSVKNPRNHSFNAQALIRVFRGFTADESESTTFADLAGTATVSTRLAGNKTRTAVTDVMYSDKIPGCNSVDITRLEGRN